MTTPREDRSRFRGRQWRRRLRALRPFLITFGVVALVAFGGWVVFWSTWLAAEQVELSGQDKLSDEELLAAADIDLGTPMARLDLETATQRLLDVPAVADVEVDRSWPHTVTIVVTERQPIASIYHQRGWWVLDAEGVIFRETGHRLKRLPVVEAHPDVEPEALEEVASVVASLPPDVLDITKRLKARSMDSIRLVLNNGREVVWGSAAESERKVEVLAVLLQRKAEVYDVSVPEQPTTADQ